MAPMPWMRSFGSRKLLYVDLEDPDGALRHLHEFGNANPQYVTDMLLGQGEILVRLGRETEAVQLLAEELQQSPDEERLHDANVQLHLILAQDAVEEERYGEADRVLNRALNSYPGNPSVRYARALLFQERGRLRRSANALEELVEDYPEDAGFLNALGYLLTDELGRHDEALPLLRQGAGGGARQSRHHRQHGLGAVPSRRARVRAGLP